MSNERSGISAAIAGVFVGVFFVVNASYVVAKAAVKGVCRRVRGKRKQ